MLYAINQYNRTIVLIILVFHPIVMNNTNKKQINSLPSHRDQCCRETSAEQVEGQGRGSRSHGIGQPPDLPVETVPEAVE